MEFRFLGCGLGLRPEYYDHILTKWPRTIDWFEAVSENFMGIEGRFPGRPLKILSKVREHYPIVLHGVSLSIGSVSPLNKNYLKKLKSLVAQIEPELISDHLCWTEASGHNLHDLLPIPYTQEALKYVVERIQRVQDYLGRQILVENVSTYLEFSHSEMPEWEFITEVAKQADCGILLDVNNIFVSSTNHLFDPMEYLRAIPQDRVGQIHLAGHSVCKERGQTYLIDTHDHPVCESVWNLFRKAIHHFGKVSSMVERDDHFPPWQELEAEVKQARKIIKGSCELTNCEQQRRACGAQQLASQGGALLRAYK